MSDRPPGLAFLSHPYHRGGVTRWMVDAAAACVSAGTPCWFVVPRPSDRFISGADRPTITDLIEELGQPQQPAKVTPLVGAEFEFGTAEYRARVYARALQSGVPVGVPVIVSDDPDTWRAVAMLDGRNALVGVLHADEAVYYSLAERYRNVASAIVAVSRRVLARASPLLNGAATVCDVIPCGIPLSPERLQRENHTTESRLVWVGRISERQKRVSDLVRIAAALNADGTPFRLDVIGDGDDGDPFRNDMLKAGLGPRVRFHGWLPSSAVYGLLRESEVMLLPSNFEGMPVAAMEALGAGCAVVASDTSGLEEYAHLPASRDALWIYPGGNVGAAVTAIHHSLRTPAERRQVAARQLAEAEFSIERCMGRYQQLLDRIPRRSMTGTSIPKWHPADIVSRVAALGRQWRVRLARRSGDQALPRRLSRTSIRYRAHSTYRAPQLP